MNGNQELRVDRERLCASNRGHFGGFRPDSLKIDMTINEDIEC